MTSLGTRNRLATAEIIGDEKEMQVVKLTSIRLSV